MALMFSGASLAHAYNAISCNPSWPFYQMPIRFYIDLDCSMDVSFDQCKTALEDSFKTWTDVDCSYMEWKFGGATDATPAQASKKDGMTLAVWEEDEWPPDLDGAIAVNTPIFEGCEPGVMLDADILFNGVDYQWATNGNMMAMDIAHIATHEIGHAVGLDHTDAPGATMLPSTSQGQIESRTLEQDDIDGICSIYPVPKPEDRVGDACDSVCEEDENHFCAEALGDEMCTRNCVVNEHCPEGFVCARVFGHGFSCWLEGDAEFGEECVDQLDCPRDLICRAASDQQQGVCTHSCAFGCETGYVCRESREGDEACLLPRIAKLGEDCSDAECEEGLICGTMYHKTICTTPCVDNYDCAETDECINLQNGEKGCWVYISKPEAMLVNLTADPAGSAGEGEEVTFSALAYGPHEVLYQYWVTPEGGDYRLMQAYDSSPDFVWEASPIGTYTIKVQVRDRLSLNDFDEEMEIGYEVTEPLPVDPSDGDVDGFEQPEQPGAGAAGGSGGCSQGASAGSWIFVLLLAVLSLKRRGRRVLQL